VIKIMLIIEIDCKGVGIEITEVADVIITEETMRRNFIRESMQDHRTDVRIVIPIDTENVMREAGAEIEEKNPAGDPVININLEEVQRRLE